MNMDQNIPAVDVLTKLGTVLSAERTVGKHNGLTFVRWETIVEVPDHEVQLWVYEVDKPGWKKEE